MRIREWQSSGRVCEFTEKEHVVLRFEMYLYGYLKRGWIKDSVEFLHWYKAVNFERRQEIFNRLVWKASQKWTDTLVNGFTDEERELVFSILDARERTLKDLAGIGSWNVELNNGLA